MIPPFGSPPTPDATASVKGKLQLTGDLGGTAASPQVTNLHLVGDTSIGHKLTNVTDPTSAQDAATKAYADAVASGLAIKTPVKYATATALPTNTYSSVTKAITGAGFGALSIDGATPSIGDSILVKNEATQSNNGWYVVTTVGGIATLFVLTRRSDSNQKRSLDDSRETKSIARGPRARLAP